MMENYEEMFIDDREENPNLFVCDAKEKPSWEEFCSDYHNFDSIQPHDGRGPRMPGMMEVIYLNPIHTHAVIFMPDYIYAAMWVTRREQLDWLSSFIEVRVTTSIKAFASYVSIWKEGYDDRVMNILGALKYREQGSEIHENDLCFFEKTYSGEKRLVMFLHTEEGSKRKKVILPFDEKEYREVQRQLTFNWDSIKQLQTYYVNVGWGYRFLINDEFTYAGIQEANRHKVNLRLTLKEESLDIKGILQYDDKEETYVYFDEREDHKAFPKAMNIQSYVDEAESTPEEIKFVKRAMFINKLHTTAIVMMDDASTRDAWIDHCLGAEKDDKLIDVKTVRVVSSIEEFMEKVLLLSLGLKDNVIEVYKAFLQENDEKLINPIVKACVRFANERVNYSDFSKEPLLIHLVMNNGEEDDIELNPRLFYELEFTIRKYFLNCASNEYVVDSEYGHKLRNDLKERIKKT